MISTNHLLLLSVLGQFCQAHTKFMVSFQGFDPGFHSALNKSSYLLLLLSQALPTPLSLSIVLALL